MTRSRQDSNLYGLFLLIQSRSDVVCGVIEMSRSERRWVMMKRKERQTCFSLERPNQSPR